MVMANDELASEDMNKRGGEQQRMGGQRPVCCWSEGGPGFGEVRGPRAATWATSAGLRLRAGLLVWRHLTCLSSLTSLSFSTTFHRSTPSVFIGRSRGRG